MIHKCTSLCPKHCSYAHYLRPVKPRESINICISLEDLEAIYDLVDEDYKRDTFADFEWLTKKNILLMIAEWNHVSIDNLPERMQFYWFLVSTH